jgi:hypothetical protein
VVICGQREQTVDSSETMATTKSQISPPRGMSERQAAAYWGVSPGTYRKMIRLGIAPAPLTTPGIERKIHDRQAIDIAMTAHRAIRAKESEQPAAEAV